MAAGVWAAWVTPLPPTDSSCPRASRAALSGSDGHLKDMGHHWCMMITTSATNNPTPTGSIAVTVELKCHYCNSY